MKTTKTSGFTLIEIMTVTAIIGVISAFLFAGISKASSWSKISRTKAELAKIEAAIDSYKAYKAIYPPANGNTNTPEIAPLFYELSGTIFLPPDKYEMLKGTEVILSSQISYIFNIGGFVNASTEPSEVREIIPIIRDKESKSIHKIVNIQLLVVSVEGPKYELTIGINPVCYRSPGDNNQSTYDLWADIKVGKNYYRICNWQRDPILLPK